MGYTYTLREKSLFLIVYTIVSTGLANFLPFLITSNEPSVNSPACARHETSGSAS